MGSCCSSAGGGEAGRPLGSEDREDKAARAAAAAERRQAENTHRNGHTGISTERQAELRYRQLRDEYIGMQVLPRNVVKPKCITATSAGKIEARCSASGQEVPFGLRASSLDVLKRQWLAMQPGQ